MESAGLVPKAYFDEARQSGEHFIRELRASSATNERLLEEIKTLREELEDVRFTAEFSRRRYSNLNEKHIELITDHLELLNAFKRARRSQGSWHE